ncbi:hybrid sensor histidine kinase/response regulator [Marinobacterium arenosum]|uniref:hybrid sensor histidine kinase/response regulator n=1 Tax=Marinobacterium arenosum TaxID=2862496 RepID=UPI001C952E81|nr:hybrid sensor histidine kinase/response regulator [Marinobacterium arenosum]MBY4677652.1 response regulator [Marinobacterium arenosum]
MRILLYALLMLLLLPVNLHAQQAALTLTDTQARYVVGAELGLLQAPAGELTIEAITAPDSPVVFSPSPPGDSRSIGYTHDTIWARLQIHNNSAHSDWWIEGDHSRVQSIILYQQDSAGNWQPLQLGASTPVSQRPIKHRANLFPVTIRPGQTRTVYLKINTHTSVNLSPKVWQPSAFRAATDQKTMLLVLLCGVLLGIGIYYLLVTFVLREALYVYFSLFILSFLTYFAAFNGLILQYAGGLNSDLAMRLIPISIAVTNFFYLAFSTAFLQTRQFSRSWWRILNGLLITTLLMTGVCLWADIRTASQLITLITPVNLIAALAAGITVMYKGNRAARMFLLSLFIFILTAALFNFGVMGVIPHILSESEMLVTLLGIIPLFAVSFADRYNLLRREHEQSQQRTLDAERQLTQSLEHQVAERTRQLNLAKEQAEAASAAKGEFLAMMSHELRTPMTAVLGATQLMDKTSLTPDNRQLLYTVDNAGKQLLALIDDVLDMSQVEKGEVSLQQQRFQPADVIREAVTLTQSLADEKGLGLSLSINDLPLQAIGDPVRIRQVLANLINNAIKYTDRGEIRVYAGLLDAKAEPTTLMISVEDTGRGIPAEMQSRIFQPFEQADNSIRRRQGGIGLGLAICKRLVEAMGGDIGLESDVGTGSVFWFTVNLQPPQTIPIESERPAPAPAPLKILLADDTAQNRDIIGKLLQHDGHQVMAVTDGQAAADALARQTFDLVLMDLQMPGMDGFEATRLIRQQHRQGAELPPIFALTANATREVIERCENTVMDGWVSKPLRLQALYRALAHYRDRRPDTAHAEPSQDAAPPNEYQGYLTPEELKQLIAQQQDALQQADRQLRAAQAEGQLTDMAQAAHRLANGAGLLGQTTLMQLARQLENAALSQDPALSDNLFRQYLTLMSEHSSEQPSPPLH